MAFPYSWESGLEEATVGSAEVFQTETDTASKLSISHYTNLARFRLAPHSGAYALMIDQPVGDNTNAFISKTSSLDLGLGTTRFLRFYYYLSENFSMASGEGATLLEVRTDAEPIAKVGIKAKADNRIYAWLAQSDAAASDSPQELNIGTNEPPWTGDTPETRLGGRKSALMKWFHFELRLVRDDGPSQNGTLTLWVNDTQVGSVITGLDQGEVTEVRVGYIQFQGAPIGQYVIDDIKVDNARIFMDQPDAGQSANRWVTASEDHPLVGPGCFSVALTGVGTDAVLELYDSDGVPNSLVPIDIVRNTAANERVDVSRMYNVNYGLYTILSGTSPQAFINVHEGGIHSHGGLIQRGIKTHRPLP